MKANVRSRTSGFVRSRIDIMQMRLHPESVLTSAGSSTLPPASNVPVSPKRAPTSVRNNASVLHDLSPILVASARTIQHFEEVRSDERSRLARELHDGLLQCLTGATLQLDVLLNTLEQDPGAARARLLEIKEMIVEEQAALRSWIQTVDPASRAETIPGAEFTTTLSNMCQRAEWQWGLRVALTMGSSASFSKPLACQVSRLIQEALSNVGRHARACRAHVEVRKTNGAVRLVIQDDGTGFPFHGRYRLADLAASNLGPRTLKERVSSLEGELVLSSTPTGSRLEISLPLTPRGASQDTRKRDRRQLCAPA